MKALCEMYTISYIKLRNDYKVALKTFVGMQVSWLHKKRTKNLGNTNYQWSQDPIQKNEKVAQ